MVYLWSVFRASHARDHMSYFRHGLLSPSSTWWPRNHFCLFQDKRYLTRADALLKKLLWFRKRTVICQSQVPQACVHREVRKLLLPAVWMLPFAYCCLISTVHKDCTDCLLKMVDKTGSHGFLAKNSEWFYAICILNLCKFVYTYALPSIFRGACCMSISIETLET